MKKTLLALALMGMSSAVFADALIYGGASVGRAKLNSDKETAYSVHVGTGILPIIGIEAGYTKLGDLTYKTHDTNVKTWYAAIKPSIDLGPLHIYARGGLHAWEAKGNGYKDDDVDIMYGFGAEYFLLPPLSVGVNYHNYRLDKKDVDMWALSATFHFL